MLVFAWPFIEWLENSFIVWDLKFQEIIAGWDNNDEPVKPSKDIENFERLTGYQYVGPK